MKPPSLRILSLPLSAVLIAGVCYWKASQPAVPRGPVELPDPVRTAPLFELYDQGQPSSTVRLSAYLGRHPILVVFFDGRAGADADPLLLRLRGDYSALKRRGAIVLAVSEALPQENRAAAARSGEFPFPLLSDPGLDVHRLFGRLAPETADPLPGAFLIDRAGRVPWTEDGPRPLDDPDRTVDELLGTR